MDDNVNDVKIKPVLNAELIPQIAQLLSEGRTVTLRARGWSMRVFVEHERDSVLLGAPHHNSLKRGDVVLAEVAPQYYVLHRIVRIDGDLLTLEGDGNIHQQEQCDRNSVLAVALGFYRKGRMQLDSCDGLKWRIYSSIWLTLRPFRRYILAAYRRLWMRFFAPI